MKLESLGIIFLFSFVSNMLHGQYIPIVEEGKFWIYLNHFDSDHPVAVSGHAITFQGDTIINSFSYKKVYKHGLSGEHNCQFPPCFQFDIPYQTISKTLVSFIREDTVNKKVFNLPALNYGFCDTIEHLIFDYSLDIGDTINSCIYEFIGADFDHHPPLGIVDSIKVTERFGKNRTTIFTTGTQKYEYLPIIGEILILEGVGLENYGIFHEPLSYLVDFCEGGMETCEIILANSTLESKKEVNIFPNPTNGVLQISIEKEELKSIRIFSAMGVFVTDFIRTNSLDVSNLEEGIYFLELTSENGDRIVKKIVKEN